MFIPSWIIIVLVIFIPGLMVHIYKQGYNDAINKK